VTTPRSDHDKRPETWAAVALMCALVAPQATAQTPSLARVPQAAVRAVAVEAANTDGDVKAFQRDFAAGIARLCLGCNYQIVPLVPLSLRSELTAGAHGPISGFYLSASDLIRKRKPVSDALWTDGVTVLVVPLTVKAPNIEKILVLRDGRTIAPLSTSLQSTELGTGGDVKATLNGGRVVFPLSAFEPGADVRIVLVPTDGANLVTRLSRADISMLR
jgi:hypothetical protein